MKIDIDAFDADYLTKLTNEIDEQWVMWIASWNALGLVYLLSKTEGNEVDAAIGGLVLRVTRLEMLVAQLALGLIASNPEMMAKIMINSLTKKLRKA